METSLGDRQFNRAYISMRDMDRCIESLECAASALESKDYKAARALITAAVVCYARPFSGNIDHPRAIAHPSFKLRTPSPAERALNKHVLALPNKVIPPSDAERTQPRPKLSSSTRSVAASKVYATPA